MAPRLGSWSILTSCCLDSRHSCNYVLQGTFGNYTRFALQSRRCKSVYIRQSYLSVRFPTKPRHLHLTLGPIGVEGFSNSHLGPLLIVFSSIQTCGAPLHIGRNGFERIIDLVGVVAFPVHFCLRTVACVVPPTKACPHVCLIDLTCQGRFPTQVTLVRFARWTNPLFLGCVCLVSFFHPPSSHAAAATSGKEGRVAIARGLSLMADALFHASEKKLPGTCPSCFVRNASFPSFSVGFRFALSSVPFHRRS